MKNIGTIIAAAFLGVVLLAYMCTFQVRFTEVAIRKTWGQPAKDPIVEPGLYFKWPRPVQSVVKYDKRIQILEDRTEETRTGDGKNVLLTVYTLWRLADPAKFHTNFPLGVEQGEKNLRTTIVTEKRTVTGQRSFNEFVSTDPSSRHLRDIEKAMKEAVADVVMREFGIEIVELGIKKLALPESVTATIFEAMKTHEQKKSANYSGEGDARANAIVAEARAAEGRIFAAAQQKVSEIETEAQRVVSEYYKEFDKHPDLRIFLDGLRTLEQALQQRTTLILDTTEFPWNLFSESGRSSFVPGEKAATLAPTKANPSTTSTPKSE